MQPSQSDDNKAEWWVWSVPSLGSSLGFIALIFAGGDSLAIIVTVIALIAAALYLSPWYGRQTKFFYKTVFWGSWIALALTIICKFRINIYNKAKDTWKQIWKIIK